MGDAPNQKPNPPNLDLIEMVQQARMMHDRDARPSQMGSVYWIEAKRPEDSAHPGPTPRSGEWVIETTVDNVDATWAVIKAATESGKLGYKSKVSTAARDGTDERSIRVRTYDAADQVDVERVRSALMAMGITPERYSTDKE
jgi:hypothetical protein